MGWLTGWSYRKKITIRNDNIDSALTEHPSYIRISDNDIGALSRADGYDLRFTLLDGTLLTHERENYTYAGTGSAGDGHYFIKINLSNVGTNEIFVYFGNASAGDVSDPENTWNANYAAVHHLKETSPPFIDSTSSDFDSADVGTPTQDDGKIYKGQSFDGSTDFEQWSADADLDVLAGDWTIMIIVYHDDSTLLDVIIHKSDVMAIYIDGSDFVLCDQDYGAFSSVKSTGKVLTGDWHMIHVVHINADDSLDIYIDGELDTAGTLDFTDQLKGWFLGCYGGVQWFWDGRLDEWRVASDDFSAAWIKWTYVNIFKADNDLVFGALESEIYYEGDADESWSFGQPVLIDNDNFEFSFGSVHVIGECTTPAAPSVVSGAPTQTIIPSGIASGESFGSHTIYNSDQYILPSGIASGESFGTPQLNLTIQATGIASGEALGTPQLNLRILASAIASGEAFGTPTLGLYILPSGIASGEAFGTTIIYNSDQYILPSGIPSGEAFGTTIIYNSDQYIIIGGIPSGEAFGTALVTTGTQYIQPNGIASGEAFGTPQLNLRIFPSAIVSGEAFGTPQLNLRIFPNGIPSGEAFGTTIIYNSDQYILPGSIVSSEAFGTTTISIVGVSVGEFPKLEPRDRIVKLVPRARIPKLE